jgi:dihydroorotate dehydrogenase (NAD+) catalytic subunit
MNEGLDISVDFAGIRLANPVFTASGTSGYADELGDFMDVSSLGGFITKSITVKPRKGNATPRIVETDSGMLNAIGWANIGLDAFIEEKLAVLEKLSCSVFVNIAGETIDEYVAVVERLAGERAIAGLELNISCPNVEFGGISFGTDPEQVAEVTSAVKKVVGDKVLMVKLAPAVTNVSVIAQVAVDAGADAISLINTFTDPGEQDGWIVGAGNKTDSGLLSEQGLQRGDQEFRNSDSGDGGNQDGFGCYRIYYRRGIGGGGGHSEFY